MRGWRVIVRIDPPSASHSDSTRPVRAALDHLDPVIFVDQATVRVEVTVQALTARAAADYVSHVLRRQAVNDGARVDRVELLPAVEPGGA